MKFTAVIRGDTLDELKYAGDRARRAAKAEGVPDHAVLTVTVEGDRVTMVWEWFE
jgi:hypothetical protein